MLGKPGHRVAWLSNENTPPLLPLLYPYSCYVLVSRSVWPQTQQASGFRDIVQIRRTAARFLSAVQYKKCEKGVNRNVIFDTLPLPAVLSVKISVIDLPACVTSLFSLSA